MNQISIQNNTASDITIYNTKRPLVKTEPNPTNTSTAVLGSNNKIGNTGNFSEHGGRSKQQGSTGNRTVTGVVPANSRRDVKVEIAGDQDFFDDDDDIIAAIADEDYFGIDEDFDMEQIDRLEVRMQNRNTTERITKSNCNTEIIESEDLQMLCDGDEVFEDDFITDDFPSEDLECVEIKPLHQRICNEGTMGIIHPSKKAKMSSSSSMEVLNHSRNTSSSNDANIHTESHIISKRPTNLKKEPVQFNNSRFAVSSGLIKTEPCSRPSTSGTLELLSTKRRSITKSATHPAIPSSAQTSSLQIQKGGSKDNYSFTATDTVAHANHPHQSNPFEAQGNNTIGCFYTRDALSATLPPPPPNFRTTFSLFSKKLFFSQQPNMFCGGCQSSIIE